MKITKAKQKKLDKKELRRKDKAWAVAVKDRDNHKCVICSKSEYLNAHHIVPREVKELRHDIHNGISVCPFHHKWSKELSFHKNPLAAFVWMQYNRPLTLSYLISKFKKDYHEQTTDQ